MQVERHLERALGVPPGVAAHEVLERRRLPDPRDAGRGSRVVVAGVVLDRVGGSGDVARRREELTDGPQVPCTIAEDAVRVVRDRARRRVDGRRRDGIRLVGREPVVERRAVVGLDDPRPQQGPEHLHRPLDECLATRRLLVVVEQQGVQGCLLALPLVEHVEHHRVVDAHLRGQRLGRRRDEPVVRGLGVGQRPLGRLAADDATALLGVVARLGEGLLVLDDVLGRLDDDVAHGVEAGPPGPPGDLVELARAQHPLLAAVVLRQRGEQHGADRDVDAHPEGVGAADDGEQPGLGEGLDEPAVLRQHPGVVHADPVEHEPAEGGAEALAEPEVAHGILDRGLAFAGDQLDAGERLGLLHRRRPG